MLYLTKNVVAYILMKPEDHHPTGGILRPIRKKIGWIRVSGGSVETDQFNDSYTLFSITVLRNGFMRGKESRMIKDLTAFYSQNALKMRSSEIRVFISEISLFLKEIPGPSGARANASSF